VCPDANTLAAYVEGQLDPALRDDVVRHLDTCEACLAIAAIGSQAATVTSTETGGSVEGDPLAAGRLGRYEIISVLGTGGMGIVYLARDPQLERRIALKVIRRGSADAPARARLVREARVMARLSHPNIVTVFDAGETDGEAYIAMELVEGTTLARWLAAEPRAPAQILAKFCVAGRALQAAHEANIVHRDFKPANVLFDARGRVVVADFGIAQVASIEGEDGPLTQEGVIVGTPGYMSPEQRAGTATNASSDQYSFAVALYRALFDLVPQEAGGPELPSDRRQRVPDSVHAALARALNADPRMRFATMTDLVDALDAKDRRRRAPLIVGGAVCALALVAGVRTLRTRTPPTAAAGVVWHGAVAPFRWVTPAVRTGPRSCETAHRLEDIHVDVVLDDAHRVTQATVEANLARGALLPCDGAPFSLERQRWSATTAPASGSALHITLQPDRNSQSNALELELPAGIAGPGTLVWHPRSSNGNGVPASFSLQRDSASESAALAGLDRAALVTRVSAAGYAVDESSSESTSDRTLLSVFRSVNARRSRREDNTASRARVELTTFRAPELRACTDAAGVTARDAQRLLCIQSPGGLHLATENLLGAAIVPPVVDAGAGPPEVAGLIARIEDSNFSVDAVYADAQVVIFDVSRVREPAMRAYLAVFARGDETRELPAGLMSEACLAHNRYVVGWTTTTLIACAGSAPLNRVAADRLLATIR
jgi:hypothetical protein